jgi:hypothetical protein
MNYPKHPGQTTNTRCQVGNDAGLGRSQVSCKGGASIEACLIGEIIMSSRAYD